MKAAIVLIALLLGGFFTGSAVAADMKPYQPSMWRADRTVPRDVPPFSRSERSQAVWASAACWTDCGSYCAWGQTQCLERDSQGTCIKLTDKCDRYCQRQCRTSGGPLLPIEFPWE
jgi:hypothetical protein